MDSTRAHQARFFALQARSVCDHFKYQYYLQTDRSRCVNSVRPVHTVRRALFDVARSDKHVSGLYAFGLRIRLWIRHVHACVEHAFNYIRYALLAMMTWIHGKMCLADIGDEHSETSSLVTTTPSSSSLTCGASGRACSGTSTTIIQTSIGYGLSSSSQSSATRQEASITASCKPSGLLHVG